MFYQEIRLSANDKLIYDKKATIRGNQGAWEIDGCTWVTSVPLMVWVVPPLHVFIVEPVTQVVSLKYMSDETRVPWP